MLAVLLLEKCLPFLRQATLAVFLGETGAQPILPRQEFEWTTVDLELTAPVPGCLYLPVVWCQWSLACWSSIFSGNSARQRTRTEQRTTEVSSIERAGPRKPLMSKHFWGKAQRTLKSNMESTEKCPHMSRKEDVDGKIKRRRNDIIEAPFSEQNEQQSVGSESDTSTRLQ